ncbi:ROK family protein [Clostridium sp. YIM B02515]|uniref:ROK family protein n=1 Tax=Clostridium rhizosphaerae TaxID=2803861 RepID=A0ABS1T9Y1_9CLOT|nr:ROK family protein [Clostridium rhizosphaerae]MBL4936166.1 ROK family protein [Clostridium rhizosphaerae]
MKNIACFDIGGTFIKYGVVNETGKILYKGKFESPKTDCKNTIPRDLIKKIKEMQEKYEIHAVGISTPGNVDSKNGEIIFASDNLPGYTGAKLSESIKNETNLDCYVENDVNAAALGELWLGAGRGKDTFVCIALGTGIGGAIIINNKIYKGIGQGAGEIGHTTIDIHGEKCACGGTGCYERYGSTSALIRNYAALANINVSEINGEEIIDRVKKGESLAVKVYEKFINNVAIGIVNLVHLLDPGIVIIGGGISAQGKPFFDKISSRFKEMVMPSYSNYTKIVQAELRNDAGIIGAAYNALNNENV